MEPSDQILQRKQEELKELQERYREIRSDSIDDFVQDRIKKLHEYNEVKDIGQMLLGIIAEREGVTIKDLYKRFELDVDD
jgi:DNA repair protein Swi5/Sae3